MLVHGDRLSFYVLIFTAYYCHTSRTYFRIVTGNVVEINIK